MFVLMRNEIKRVSFYGKFPVLIKEKNETEPKQTAKSKKQKNTHPNKKQITVSIHIL